MTIASKLEEIKKSLPDHVTLVAVSKTHSVSTIMEAYKAGQRVFGENKVQEMVSKWQELPKDIEWHMIGHLQRNKVKYMAEFVKLIHGVDSIKLLKEINKQAEKHERIIDCLVQLHIAKEDTKFGMSEDELMVLFTSDILSELKNIRITGFMGMATFTDNTDQIKAEFQFLRNLYVKFKNNQDKLPDNVALDVLSMGMSGDYELAIKNGSTMVRIGSSIFGSRNYKTD